MSNQPPEPGQPQVPDPAAIHCPRCSTPIGPDQDWCLECGAPARTRLAQTPNWQLPTVAIGAIVLLAGALLAFAFVKLTNDDGATPAATTAAPAAPAAVDTAPPAVVPPPVTAPVPSATTTAPSAPIVPSTVPGQTTPVVPPSTPTVTTPAPKTTTGGQRTVPPFGSTTPTTTTP